ncbi:glycosyltransferase family 2 protein [Flavobacterium polysaccharolyticum]|uniref:Glycosyltransferase family 2 protein n=1 Tax=Flavobacterium polysaccharolyticum TaxID=3133148 RepID=A0ABU9NQY3_9FLAO
MEKLVSIIIPTYNSADFIADTLASVQQQTYPNWEVILVDDGSTDTTVTIAQNIAQTDHRIRIFKNLTNSGTGVTRNNALHHCQGNYIAFLDADDLWKSNKLERQLQFMQEQQQPFTFSFYECIDEAGNPLNRLVEAPKNLSYRQLFFCNYVGNLTGIYDADFFEKIAISSIRKRQDWMLWLTILKKLKSAKPIPESLAYYRIRNNSLSASKVALLQHNFAVYRQFHRYNFVVSLFIMIGFLFTQLLIKPRYIKNVVTV